MHLKVRLVFRATGQAEPRPVVKGETLPRSGLLEIFVDLDEPAFLYLSALDPSDPWEPTQPLLVPKVRADDAAGPGTPQRSPAGTYRFPADPQRWSRLDRSPGPESVLAVASPKLIDPAAKDATAEEREAFLSLGLGRRGIPPRSPEGGQGGRDPLVADSTLTANGIAIATFPYVHG